MTTSDLVAIVDDDEALRESLSMVLGSVGLDVLGFHTSTDFLCHLEQIKCSCLLLDMRMPGMSGVELQRRLGELNAQMPIVFMSGHGDIETAVKVMKQGAVDFLRKPFSRQLLIDTVQGVIEAWKKELKARDRHEHLRRRVQCLSPREQEVFAGLGAGRSAKVVAHELGIALKTVEEHRSHIFAKLDIHSSSELIAEATELRLLDQTRSTAA
ncbi:MAG: response regulator transcription factor [Rhodocyclales bacterium]|nr:response regulator transcription factor [Rhodocyclales bacterium]